MSEKSYKTLLIFGGRKYISLAEHEEIVKALTNFNSAVDQVKEALNTISSFTKNAEKAVESVEI